MSQNINLDSISEYVSLLVSSQKKNIDMEERHGKTEPPYVNQRRLKSDSILHS